MCHLQPCIFFLQRKRSLEKSERNNYRVLIGEFMLSCSLLFFLISPMEDFFDIDKWTNRKKRRMNTLKFHFLFRKSRLDSLGIKLKSTRMKTAFIAGGFSEGIEMIIMSDFLYFPIVHLLVMNIETNRLI